MEAPEQQLTSQATRELTTRREGELEINYENKIMLSRMALNGLR